MYLNCSFKSGEQYSNFSIDRILETRGDDGEEEGDEEGDDVHESEIKKEKIDILGKAEFFCKTYKKYLSIS